MPKIYTKTGDYGKSSVIGSNRLSKDSLVFEALGNIDELNAFVGIVCSEIKNKQTQKQLENIQNLLFKVGVKIADIQHKLHENINAKDTEHLEKLIDGYDKKLPKLTNFILPGGKLAGANLHLARAICRRAERSVVRLKRKNLKEEVRFLNRLSDFLFVLARNQNMVDKYKEKLWQK